MELGLQSTMSYGIGEGLPKVCFDEEIHCNEKRGWLTDRFGLPIWTLAGIVLVLYAPEWVARSAYAAQLT